MKIINFLKRVLINYFYILGFFVALYVAISFVNMELFYITMEQFTFWCRFTFVSATFITILEKWFDAS